MEVTHVDQLKERELITKICVTAYLRGKARREQEQQKQEKELQPAGS